ncbi:MAG: hypothetical protein GXW85_07870 [Clostridia bacterium]|nr:hypothetical protein [Clostridia bacterium]
MYDEMMGNPYDPMYDQYLMRQQFGSPMFGRPRPPFFPFYPFFPFFPFNPFFPYPPFFWW